MRLKRNLKPQEQKWKLNKKVKNRGFPLFFCYKNVKIT